MQGLLDLITPSVYDPRCFTRMYIRMPLNPDEIPLVSNIRMSNCTTGCVFSAMYATVSHVLVEILLLSIYPRIRTSYRTTREPFEIESRTLRSCNFVFTNFGRIREKKKKRNRKLLSLRLVIIVVFKILRIKLVQIFKVCALAQF